MKIAGTHVKPWMIVAGAVGVIWYLNRPKTGAQIGATGAAAGLDAGRHGGGGHGHGHHFRVRGPVGPSWAFVGTDYTTCDCPPGFDPACLPEV